MAHQLLYPSGMEPSRPVSPETTVAEVFERSPEAGAALRSRGIDSCCSGALTLRQAAEARGIGLDELMAAIGGSSGDADRKRPVPPRVQGSDSIRRILAQYPQTSAVFETFGLMGCGGTGGPDERIDFFARMHRVDAERLIADLNDAIAKGPVAGGLPGGGARPLPKPLYPAFLRAAIWSTLTLGATFGGANLVAMYATSYEVPTSHHQIHALFQVWGFTLLFIMGVACHATPRFFGAELVRPRLARSTFWMIAAGLVLQMYGRFDEWAPARLPALGAGAALILAGVATWACLIAATWSKAGSPRDASNPFLTMGTLWWVTAAGLLAFAAGKSILRGDVVYGNSCNEAIYGAALFGGALAWIQGMFLRSGPIFLGLRPTRRWLVKLAFFAGQAGTLGAVAGSFRPGFPFGMELQSAGILGVAVSVAAFVAGVRPFEGDGGHFTDGDRGFVRVVRTAFVFSLVFALIGGAYAVGALTGRPLSRLTWDGARHAFTLGFLTLMIFGMAGRIVPIFGGVPLQWPALRTGGAMLISAGVLLRLAEVAASIHFEPWLLTVAGTSGLVAALGVILAGLSLLRTLGATPAAGPAVAAGEVPLSGESNVAALVAAHPEALPILIEAGLTPLANPVLRNTMARMVTLERGCRMHGIDVEAVLAKIRAACTHAPATPRTFSV